jgi:hypothetical protein
MKKIIFIMLFITSSAMVFGQEVENDSIVTDSISTEFAKEKIVKVEGEVLTKTTDRFKIYPTSNMYNFLLLDTQTGRVWKIQWNLESNKRFQKEVSLKILVDYDEEWINGRFELYPTENMHNFLLLDKIYGRVWQLQWSFEAKNNWITEIF